MSLIDDAIKAATMAVPGPGPDAAAENVFNAMSIAELASVWSALQRVSLRDHTDGTWDATTYFDRLPHDMAERALDLVLEVLRSENDKPVLMQLNGRLMPALLYAHGVEIIDRLETEVRDNARLRWLLGGLQWSVSGEPLKTRIRRIADIPAWAADHQAHRTPAQPINCEAMSLPELAAVWVEQHSKAEKDRDDNWHTLYDYESDLKDEDPDKMFDLILEILKIETNPMVLSLLAAGPLEDIIGMETIDRVEREAAANDRFHDLLGGVWYSSAPQEIQTRLDAILRSR